eukprot:738461-Amphidinium_carterae.1
MEEHAKAKTWGHRNQTKAAPHAAESLAESLQKLLSVLPTPDEASHLLRRNATAGEAYQIMDALMHFSSKRESKRALPHETSAQVWPRSSKTLNVSWPNAMEPAMLACSSDTSGHPRVAVFTSAGHGAVVLAQPSREAQTPQRVALAGMERHAPIIGASWTSSTNIVLVTHSGTIMECAEPAHDSAEWPCLPLAGVEGTVPVADDKLLAA